VSDFPLVKFLLELNLFNSPRIKHPNWVSELLRSIYELHTKQPLVDTG